jgi:glutathione peroxidase-family protein
LLLTPQGKILARFRGPLKPSDLRSAIEKNL